MQMGRWMTELKHIRYQNREANTPMSLTTLPDMPTWMVPKLLLPYMILILLL